MVLWLRKTLPTCVHILLSQKICITTPSRWHTTCPERQKKRRRSLSKIAMLFQKNSRMLLKKSVRYVCVTVENLLRRHGKTWVPPTTVKQRFFLRTEKARLRWGSRSLPIKEMSVWVGVSSPLHHSSKRVYPYGYTIMTKWIILTVVIISGSIFGYFLLLAKPNTTTPLRPESSVVTIRHSFKDGEHRYTGGIWLPHSCFAVTADIAHIPNDPTALLLTLATKDHLLDQLLCFQFSAPYQFEAYTEALEQSTLKLKVDGKDTPVNLVETMWQSGKGTLIN